MGTHYNSFCALSRNRRNNTALRPRVRVRLHSRLRAGWNIALYLGKEPIGCTLPSRRLVVTVVVRAEGLQVCLNVCTVEQGVEGFDTSSLGQRGRVGNSLALLRRSRSKVRPVGHIEEVCSFLHEVSGRMSQLVVLEVIRF